MGEIESTLPLRSAPPESGDAIESEARQPEDVFRGQRLLR